MTIQLFIAPRLTGKRFEGASIPLELLREWSVFEEMIVEVAKWKFLEDNPNRKRSPRGFTDGIDLVLAGVGHGSARPIIHMVIAASSLFPLDNQQYFEEARDAVVSAIAAAEHNRSPSEHLPERILGYFDRFGRSLRDNEAIEFSDKNNEKVRLTKEVRRRIVLASSKVSFITEDTTVRGTIPEADQDDMKFEVQLVDGRKVQAPMTDQILDTIIEAFSGYRSGTRVLLQGVGKIDRNERLVGFESVEHVVPLDPLDVSSRLEELQLIKDGWIEGKGVAPAVDGLKWLACCFEQNYSDELPLPYLYPTPEGGVQAEWSSDANDATLEINLSSRIGRWHNLHLENEEAEERELDLGLESGWKWIAETVAEVFGDAS